MLFTDAQGAFDLFFPSRQDALVIAVPVGQHQIEIVFRDQRFNAGQVFLDRRHGARFRARRRHVFSAGDRQRQERLFVHPAGRTESGQLAEAVAAGHIGPQTETVQNPGHAQADRADGGLGDIGTAQFFLRLFFPVFGITGRENMVGQSFCRSVMEIVEQLIGRFKDIMRFRKYRDQVSGHIGILAPLTGKYKRDFADRSFGMVRYAVKNIIPGNNRLVGAIDCICGTQQDLRHVILQKVDNHQGAMFIPVIKTLAHFSRDPAERRGQAACAGGGAGNIFRKIGQFLDDIRLGGAGDGYDLHGVVPGRDHFIGPVFFKYHMIITAAETERTHGRPAGMFPVGKPGPQGSADIKW